MFAMIAAGAFDLSGGAVLALLLFFMAVVSLTDSLRDAITLAQAAHLFSPVPHVATLHR